MDFEVLIKEKTKNNEQVILEFGPGDMKIDSNAIGIDICEKTSVDYLADLSKGLSFIQDNTIDSIHAYHFLEHIENLEFFMSEINRVLKPEGKLYATVPHYANPYFYSDYTHSSFWGLYTMNYFSSTDIFTRKVPKYYNTIDFHIVDIQIIFISPFKYRNKVKKLFQLLFNSNRYMQELYEENFVYLIPCFELKIEIQKRAA